MTEALGIHLVDCGPLHPRQARDGSLFSRAVGLAEDRWLTRAFDRRRRELASEPDRPIAGGTGQLLARRVAMRLPDLGPRNSSSRG